MSARDFALIELDGKRLPGWPAGSISRRAAIPSDPRDRALAEQIINGVVKNQIHLRHLMAHHAARALKSIDPLAQKILAVGLYQMTFLTRIPKSAAVNEAVEQAKRFGRGRAAGFINAVLRKATREPGPAMPDREKQPAEYAELVLSHPKELFTRLAAVVGPADALRICEHDNAEPPIIVRLLPGAESAQLLRESLTILPHEEPGMFVVQGAGPAILAEWADNGVAQVQDPTASRAVCELDVQAGQRILDRCAGLGTKTMQIQRLAGDTAITIAVDPSPRIHTLQSTVQRRGLANVHAIQVGMMSELPEEQRGAFDRILVDAPCSNSGVLARRPEARYHQTDEAMASIIRLQDRILDDTAAHLAAGGRLVYSTCSIWPEENQRRVAAFIGRHPKYTLLHEQAILPSFPGEPRQYHDGGYVALLTRS